MAKSRKAGNDATDTVDVGEVLASTLSASLNKKFAASNQKIAFFLDGDDSPSNVTNWISTGSDILNLAISNRPDGGFPVGRIIEITGMEASGKSLLAAHALADTQRQGGLAVYIDTENAASSEFLEAIGVNLSEMLYIPLETVEDIFEAMDEIIEVVRKSAKKRIVTIVVDSVAAATTKTEQAAGYEKDGWATSKAIVLSKAMRKVTNFIGREQICLIFTNQLRVNLQASFGDPYTTSGGKAIQFHSSVRLRLKSTGQLKVTQNGVDSIAGIKTQCKVIKNRMGPPLRSVEYDIYFDSGIDNYGSWLDFMKKYKLVAQGGAWYTYVDKETGEEIKFQSKDFKAKLIDNAAIKAAVYRDICDTYILSYKAGEDFGIDDIDVETDFDSED